MNDELAKRLAALVFDPSRNVYFPDEPDRVLEHRLTTGEINEIIDALSRPSSIDIEGIAREIAEDLRNHDLHDCASMDIAFCAAIPRIAAILRRSLTYEEKS